MFDLRLVQHVLTKLDLLSFELTALEGPPKNTWILVAHVFELDAIDRSLSPLLVIFVVSFVVLVALIECLHPLIHLDLSLESI